MTDPLDDPLADLATALDIDPSPEFAARVRTQVARETPGRQWRWMAGTVAAVALVALAVWLRQPDMSDSVRPPQLVVSAGEATGLRFDGPGVRLTPPAPAAAVRPLRSGRASVQRAVWSPEPETLIAPDQAIAFQRLVRLVYEGRIVPPNPAWPKASSSLEPVEPPAEVNVPLVEVKPVVINPLMVDTMSDQEG